jgi:hypothetical protein
LIGTQTTSTAALGGGFFMPKRRDEQVMALNQKDGGAFRSIYEASPALETNNKQVWGVNSLSLSVI